MTSRYSGSIRGAGVGASRSYNGVRGNYRPLRDDERESASQQSPREITDALHAEIAAFSPEHAALVAEFERLQARRGRQS